jgi:gliotoxin/aspirochlorine biosynthesis thioredoxin reductase
MQEISSSSNSFFLIKQKNRHQNLKCHPPPTTSSTSPIDVLIIGSGPAGLSCASGLARLLHTCIIISPSQFRNDGSKHMHNVLTWEHQDRADFRVAARKDLLAHYDTISFEDNITTSS